MYVNHANKADKQIFKDNFISSCGTFECQNALDNLIASMDGSGMLGCDLLGILYNGDSNGAFMNGWRDSVVMKATYMHVLLI